MRILTEYFIKYFLLINALKHQKKNWTGYLIDILVLK